ncbi:uncharacterized protein FIESC28_06030 [Fusarium coffeatum]|uniref:Uncharacterized protein n=1 Tax=Fusarium coffeatum TaxID=231269 RepID=A0A366RQJ6_9HYPO|nr:uncharacterized protein FIESC28_06030 [Fusarium coffeatum]RBR18575.1 hypothetical protein FIESC28_06030 [Fusarium coffeatum]
MEEKLVQLQRNGLCDQRICAAISNLIEDLIWELPLAASKENIVDIEREDKYTLARFRVLKQTTETPGAGKANLRGGEGQTATQGLPRRRVKRNILPKRENDTKKPAGKSTSTKKLAKKASAAIARPTHDTLTQLEQKYHDIKQEKDNQDALITQLQRQYGDTKQEKDAKDALFTRLEQKYVDVKQEKDAANRLIKFLQRRLEDNDRVLEELQKETTESKRKDLEIYLLRDDLLKAQKELQEYREAERQKAMGDNIDGIEIPTTLPVQPSCERTASPELEFLSQTVINESRNNAERSTLVSWHLETISDDLAIWNGPTTGHALELVADLSPRITASTSPTSKEKGD